MSVIVINVFARTFASFDLKNENNCSIDQLFICNNFLLMAFTFTPYTWSKTKYFSLKISIFSHDYS